MVVFISSSSLLSPEVCQFGMLIQEAGMLLELPLAVISTACFYFARFYQVVSFTEGDPYVGFPFPFFFPPLLSLSPGFLASSDLPLPLHSIVAADDRDSLHPARVQGGGTESTSP